MTYVKGLEWQGEGGDAFRDWGGQSAAATLRLGQYAEVASRWMATVAQAVAEAKAAMPATSETAQAKADLADARKAFATTQEPGARNDPDARKLAQTAQSDAAAAQQRMEAARAEAIQQLRKLAQTYEYSAQQVNGVEPPTFSPPAQHSDNSTWWESGREYVADGSSPVGNTDVRGNHVQSGSSSGHHSSSAAPHSTVVPTPDSTRRQQAVGTGPVAMGIDGVATLPDTTAAVSPTAPTSQPASLRPEAVSPFQPGLAPPAFGSGGTTGPGAVRTPTGFRNPAAPWQGTTANPGIRAPRESGVIGGRPVAPGAGRPPGIPQGNVIGSGSGAAGAQGRPPMGRGFAPGMPPGAGANPPGGLVAGRRLAEAGGSVGNRPGQASSPAGRPFTPGGSGLIRQSPAGPSRERPGIGPQGPRPAQPAGQRSDRQDNERPDYLVEDEATWARGSRRTVPPVLD
jgi:hypothetical protein